MINEREGKNAEKSRSPNTRESVGRRLPWLLLLFGLGMAVSGVVGVFASLTARLPLIVSFQSLILGMAGNAGTQSLAVTIGRLSSDKPQPLSVSRWLAGELRVGLVNGVALGFLSFLFVGVYLALFKKESASYAFALSGCTGLAMLLSVTLSAGTGTLIPLLLKKCRIDPTAASGPLITTINDLVAVLSYYGLAHLLLLDIFGL